MVFLFQGWLHVFLLCCKHFTGLPWPWPLNTASLQPMTALHGRCCSASSWVPLVLKQQTKTPSCLPPPCRALPTYASTMIWCASASISPSSLTCSLTNPTIHHTHKPSYPPQAPPTPSLLVNPPCKTCNEDHNCRLLVS